MMDNERLNDIRKQVRELAKKLRSDLKDSWSGVPVGHVKPTDEEFVALCALNARENPNWPTAMIVADRDKDWIAKYERITGQPWESLIAIGMKAHQERMRKAAEEQAKLSTAGAAPPPAPAPATNGAVP